MKKILVYGATGSQQYPVIEALRKKGAEVYATTSSENNFPKLIEAGANPVLANMADADRLKEISKGIDAISFLIPVSIANPLDGIRYAKNVIDAAKANGIKNIVWNTSGYLPPAKIGNPMVDVKLDVKEYFESSGVAYIIIEPPIYAENLLGLYTTNYVKNERKVAYPTPEEMPIGWIASNDVGALVAEAIYKPELSGQSFRISGLENLRGNDLAEKFSIGLDEKITYYAMPPTEFGNILKGFMDEEAASSVEQYYQGMVDSKSYPPSFSSEMPTILEKFPVKMTSMEEWVKMNREIFLG